MFRVYCSCPGVFGDDEFSPRGGEISVAYVDGDALLAFCAQAIRKQGEIDGPAGTVDAALLDGCELIFVNGLGVRAAAFFRLTWTCRRPRCQRRESQQFLVQVLLKEQK